MRINNNLMAMNTHRQLGISTTAGSKSMEKLSSGYRINRAGDDAAGLAISEKMRGQIRGLTQASRNAQDGISLIQTAEGALDETHAILQRMRELAVQSSTDTNTDADRKNIQDEIDQLTTEITRIATTTQFNTMELLDGSFEGKKFHIGANEGQNISLEVKDMTSKALGLETGKITVNDGTNDLLTSKESNVKEIQFVAGSDAIPTVKVENGVVTISGISNANDKDLLNEALKKAGLDITFTAEGATALNTNGSIKVEEAAVEAGALKDLKVTISNDDINKVAFATNDAGNAVTIGVASKTLTVTAGASATLEDIQKALKDYGVRLESSSDNNEAIGNVAAAVTLEESETVGAIRVDTQERADKAVTTINDALEKVSKQRSSLGAVQNRLEHTIKNLDTSAENLQASEARIRDVDMAKEMMEQTKQNILQQASTAMLAQANQAPQTVLQLLR